jgi:alkylation response protein AidB-like acyl-CoA dehydrogenase
MSGPLGWLSPLISSLPELTHDAWRGLAELDRDLEQLIMSAPLPNQPNRSAWLLAMRRELARRGHRTPPEPAGPVWQTLAQFIAGFHDVDLRDAIGSGHGSMILSNGQPAAVERWGDRLDSGDLVGVAVTERHGGSRLNEIAVRAEAARDGRWLVTGEKCWVSRLNEAAGFVIFFRDPQRSITAAIIVADDARLERTTMEPSGLTGWSWGVLRLHELPVDPSMDLVGRPGDGLKVFRQHFAGFRPLVTATALGAAAAVHSAVAAELAIRGGAGTGRLVRDNALITLGRSYAEIVAALLYALTTSRLATAAHPHAEVTARIGKAVGVDTAVRAVRDLAPLIGATGFQRNHLFAKVRADLTGLLFADGIHDSLYRSGGRSLLHPGAQTTGLPFSR